MQAIETEAVAPIGAAQAGHRVDGRERWRRQDELHDRAWPSGITTTRFR